MSAPAMTDGRICGSRMSRSACHSLAPKSIAAFSSSRLTDASRPRTMTATNGKVKVIWAMMMLPRLSGHAKSRGHH